MIPTTEQIVYGAALIVGAIVMLVQRYRWRRVRKIRIKLDKIFYR
jgi:hypothetical protein